MKTPSTHKPGAVAVGAAAIVLLTVVAYLPAMRGGFFYDDLGYVTENRALRTPGGLVTIWSRLHIKSLPNYPLLFTSFWAEYQLWGADAQAFHRVNVALHAGVALLMWWTLRRLAVPGAWLAATVFAVHPVHVESVAWISELKNIQSTLFYLLALLAYLGFALRDDDGNERPRSRRFYFLSLVLFLCGMLSKSVIASFPAAVLLILWWKRGRLAWRDVLPLIPFFLLGMGLGLATAWIERVYTGAEGEAWSLTFLERCLVAGRAVWFYAGKLLLPVKLTFIYPRWTIDTAAWWQYLYPLTVLGGVAALWALRRRLGRGPLTAVLFFSGTLFPALGFFNVYWMEYSFVADHFQYLASMGLIALGIGLAARAFRRLGRRGRDAGIVVAALLLTILSVLTWRHARVFKSAETVWRDTVAKNPDSFTAQTNLGMLLYDRGKHVACRPFFEAALRLRPESARCLNNMSLLLRREKKYREAIALLDKAVLSKPDYADVAEETEVSVKRKLYAKIHFNLAQAHYGLKDRDATVTNYAESVRLWPYFAEANLCMAMALLERGRHATKRDLDEAMRLFERGLALRPEAPAHRFAFARLLVRRGESTRAAGHFRRALHDARRMGLGDLARRIRVEGGLQ